MAAERRDRSTYWREQAACLDEDPELIFPIGNSGPTVAQIQAAKADCPGCPVAQQCLDWAVEVGQVDGIWGGTTESERRAMRRRATRRFAADTVTKAA
jgi:WhiB family redox-sensing transcriptional regulator